MGLPKVSLSLNLGTTFGNWWGKKSESLKSYLSVTKHCWNIFFKHHQTHTLSIFLTKNPNSKNKILVDPSENLIQPRFLKKIIFITKFGRFPLGRWGEKVWTNREILNRDIFFSRRSLEISLKSVGPVLIPRNWANFEQKRSTLIFGVDNPK